MALRSGLAAQVGYVAETTYGTAVTVTRCIPLVSETVKQTIDRLESAGINPGRLVLDSGAWFPGNIKVAGDVQHELYDRGIGILLKQMFGNVVTTGSGPYTHTFTPGDLTGKSLTMQIGRPDVAGTVQPFTYAGIKIGAWEAAGKAGEIATVGHTVVGQSEVTATALASLTPVASITPFVFTGASMTIAGSAANVKAFKIGGKNSLDDGRRFIGSATISEPLDNGLREYYASADIEFSGLVQYNRFVNGTTAALVLAFAAGSNTLTFTCNVRFDGETPNVSGRDILKHTIPMKCVGTSDSAAITAVVVNGDAAP